MAIIDTLIGEEETEITPAPVATVPPPSGARFTKLRTGEWAVRGYGAAPSPGDSVPVTTKGGKTRNETIARVIWRGTDEESGAAAWLATLPPRPGASAAPAVVPAAKLPRKAVAAIALAKYLAGPSPDFARAVEAAREIAAM